VVTLTGIYTKLLDLAKAEAYFKKAIKYAVAEARNESEVSTNYLRADIKKSFGEQKTSVDSVKLQAAESYLFLSRCCYIQRRFDESADYAGKALSLVPQLAEAGFSKAKALAANNKESQAAEVLEQVINIDRYFSLKVLSDPDLAPQKEVQALLLKLQLETTEKAFKIVEQCKKQIIPDSIAKQDLSNIIELLQKNSYLSSAKVIDLLAEVKNWNLNRGIHAKLFQDITSQTSIYDGYIEITQIKKKYSWDKWDKLIKSNDCNFDLVQFLKLERDYSNNVSLLYSELKSQLAIINAKNREDRKKWEKREKINYTLNYIPCFTVGALVGAFFGAIIGIVIQIIAWIGGSSGFTPFLVVLVLGTIIVGLINGKEQDYGGLF
jgi:tetratricopeptide (TPR) repeat protein